MTFAWEISIRHGYVAELEDIRRMDGGLVTSRSVGSRRRRRTITTNAGDVAEKLHTWRSVKWKLFCKYNVGVWEI